MLVYVIDEDEKAIEQIRERVKEVAPDARIEAYEKNEAALNALQSEVTRAQAGRIPERLEVRCFGFFDVMWQGRPLIFKRKQSKELLAYLIDREGAACSSEEIAVSLWGYDSDSKAEKNRLRVLISDLKSTLKDIGMEDVLIREKREVAILKERIDCDYYRFLNGDMKAKDLYDGEYMKQYEWAELTNGRLHFMTDGQTELHNSSFLYI